MNSAGAQRGGPRGPRHVSARNTQHEHSKQHLQTCRTARADPRGEQRGSEREALPATPLFEAAVRREALPAMPLAKLRPHRQGPE